MDYDKLIEQAKKDAAGSHPVVPSWAAIVGKKQLKEYATAIKTLRAENNGLKEKLYDGEGVNLVDYWMQQAKIEENGHRNCQAENEKLRADLARVTAERDAAVSDIETALAYGVENCQLCANSQCHLRGGTKPCLPKWHGIKED